MNFDPKGVFSCCLFLCKICPLCCSVLLFVVVIIVNWVVFDFFVSFSYDSVTDLLSTRVEKEAKDFFRSKMEFFDTLRFDVESGNYDNQESYVEYEKFYYSRFREDTSISAFYSIFSNNQTFKLHRETPGVLSTQVRVFVNESYQYRWDRQRLPSETDMSNYVETAVSPKHYWPYLKGWYKGGTEVYPYGYWEGPIFSSSDDASATTRHIPMFIHVQKFIWRNSSKFSIHKVKFLTSSISTLMESIYEDESNEKIDFALISADFKVISSRSVEEQTNEAKDGFRKVWEMEKEYFQELDESTLKKAINNKENDRDERYENSGMRKGLTVVPLGSDSENWVLILYIDKQKYFGSLITAWTISIVISFVILALFILVMCLTSCAICQLCCSEGKKKKKIRLIRKLNSEMATEKRKMKDLVESLVPSTIAAKLLGGETSIVGESEKISVLFLDVAGFTQLTQNIGPEKLVRCLKWIFGEVDGVAEKYNILKLKTIGDCWMGCRGLQDVEEDLDYKVEDVLVGCVQMIQQLRGTAMDDHFSSDKEGLLENSDSGTLDFSNILKNDFINILKNLNYRIGLHYGKCVYGIIEKKSARFDIWGTTVNFASRLEGFGREGFVHFSHDVYKELGENSSKFLIEKNSVELKGFDGIQETYLCNGFKDGSLDVEDNSGGSDVVVVDSYVKYKTTIQKEEEE